MFFNKKKSEEQPVQLAIEAPEEVMTEPAFEPEPEQPEEKLEPINMTKIGKGITFNGDFTGSDPIEINGTIKGDINTTRALTISEDGSYEGSATIAEFESDGKVTGNIVCENHAVLGEKSVMDGSLRTAFLVTKEGSSFSGNLEMCRNAGKDAKPAEAPAAQEPAADAAVSLGDLFSGEAEVETDAEELSKFADEVGKNLDIPEFFDLPDGKEN